MTTLTNKWMRALVMVAALGAMYLSFVCSAVTTADFTNAQRTNTLLFLNAFAEHSTALKSSWAGDDFCNWENINCQLETGPAFAMTDTSAAGLTQLPELPEGLDGSQVVIVQLSLQLSNTLTVSTLPESWGGLTSVTIVDVSSSAMTGTLPASWGSMISLQQLTLQGNSFTGTLPSEWSSLTKVELLMLRNNQLTGTLPAAWGSMAALKKLYLYENQVSGTLPAEWASMTKLEVLNVPSNKLTGRLPDAWGSLALLQELYLDTNELSGTLPVSWASMAALTYLSLSDNHFTGSIPEQYGQLTKLTFADLITNQFCGCLPSAWVGNENVVVDAAVSASDCTTANACPVDSSSSSHSADSLSKTTSTSSSSSGNYISTECSVPHCVTCAAGNTSSCATCAVNFEATSDHQCISHGDAAARVSLGARSHWMAVVFMVVATVAVILG